MNDKNKQFYSKIQLEHFQELSERGGFNTFKDLMLVQNEIKASDSILELGAGYGRCLDYFIGHGHKGKLSAIEYSPTYYQVLKDKYQGNVQLFQGSLMNYPFPEKYNVALWMWSGIIDFSSEEQLAACTYIQNYLYGGGKLIIDIPRLGIKTIANHLDEQHLVFTTPFGEINAYIPNEDDMVNIQVKAGFNSLRKVDYETATEKKRTIYILEKK